jgi:hypothetical protein
MKKWTLSLIFVFLAGLMYGHPPSIDQMVYDPDTKLLTLNISHNITAHPANHFVKEVDISINGKEAVSQVFESQESPESEIVIYKILVKTGDVVEAYAACSLKGDTTKEITIE